LFINWASPPMTASHLDIAQVRLDNALLLFDEFVQQVARVPDAATLRGLEGRFAERLQIQPSYWSQIKGRSRQIGERLARQFEQRCGKPYGWMDVPHGIGAAAAHAGAGMAASETTADAQVPQNEDERFVVGLVLTYYRRHPERARARLLELLGEALLPAAGAAEEPASDGGKGGAGRGAAPADAELWRRARQGVAPLRRKR
jgi:hypothetical protein